MIASLLAIKASIQTAVLVTCGLLFGDIIIVGGLVWLFAKWRKLKNSSKEQHD